jgi:hypothetical protein
MLIDPDPVPPLNVCAVMSRIRMLPDPVFARTSAPVTPDRLTEPDPVDAETLPSTRSMRIDPEPVRAPSVPLIAVAMIGENCVRIIRSPSTSDASISPTAMLTSIV